MPNITQSTDRDGIDDFPACDTNFSSALLLLAINRTYMQRRQFLRRSAGAGISPFLAGPVFSGEHDKGPLSDKPFHLNYAIHDGMFSNSAGKDFVDQIK